ncbi:ABC transporter ATP-binding protein [Paenibacillus ginsengihumi]|uniref:ABC transporter ATP-binding protein n=1 Tax=Paenibacillus ginsengihumi TaxID=431596 RepID=UPI00037C225C|nr:ABC transporter ATP-binding protein [Paenibacillus ginsengihumi]
MAVPILEVTELTIAFTQYERGLRQKRITAVRDLCLSIEAGELVAVVGASGSGKSLLAHAILGILPENAAVSGSIRYEGRELTPSLLEKLRGREIALVPQSVDYLDPLMRVGKQVRTAVRQGDPVRAQRSIFERYGLAPFVEKLFPFQLSGGMARRALVATATVGGPRLVVADEPTPGLDDASVREALGRLRELADDGCAVMLITHDIAAALAVADKVAVLYAGTVVETARSADFAGQGEALRHPYSRALWRALPQNEFAALPGLQPPASEGAAGCAFAPRCAAATPECAAARPALRELRGGTVRCHHAT